MSDLVGNPDLLFSHAKPLNVLGSSTVCTIFSTCLQKYKISDVTERYFLHLSTICTALRDQTGVTMKGRRQSNL